LAHVTGAGTVSAIDVDISPDGDLIVVGGYFTGSITVSGSPVTSAGSDDMFVAVMSVSQDRILWTRPFGGSGQDRVLGVSFDSANSVLIGGRVGAALTMGTIPISNNGNGDILVAKLRASDGDPVWARGVGGTGFDEGFDVAADPSGNAVVTGYINAPSVNFG